MLVVVDCYCTVFVYQWEFDGGCNIVLILVGETPRKATATFGQKISKLFHFNEKYQAANW
jgi:hypothetical protein